jgi:hypothetical protein
MKHFFVVVSVAVLMSACNSGRLVSSPTGPSPTAPISPPAQPSTYAVSGVVFEVTPSGRVAVEGVLVEDVSCDPLHISCADVVQTATTDLNGFYRLSGLSGSQVHFLWLSKEGYRADEQSATFATDTRLDIELVRQ